MFKLLVVLLALAAAACAQTCASGNVDQCGVCDGDGTSCCVDYLGIPNGIWDWILMRVAIDDLIVKLESLSSMLACSIKTLPEYDNGECNGMRDSGRDALEKLHVREMADTHTLWLEDCLKQFTDAIPEWERTLNP